MCKLCASCAGLYAFRIGHIYARLFRCHLSSNTMVWNVEGQGLIWMVSVNPPVSPFNCLGAVWGMWDSCPKEEGEVISPSARGETVVVQNSDWLRFENLPYHLVVLIYQWEDCYWWITWTWPKRVGGSYYSRPIRGRRVRGLRILCKSEGTVKNTFLHQEDYRNVHGCKACNQHIWSNFCWSLRESLETPSYGRR